MASTLLSPLPIQCSVTGAKLLAPLTPAAICQRFIAAFAAVSGRPATAGPVVAGAGDGLIVELRFQPQGVAMASANALRAGKLQPIQRFELAVSDRGFAPDDIDRLAGNAADSIGAALAR